MHTKITQVLKNLILPDILIGIAVIFVLALAGSFLYIKLQTTPSSQLNQNQIGGSSAEQTNLYKILNPATQPSKIPECSQSISYASNGNLGPITCSNNYLNVTAWKALAALEPTVMTLGYNATISEVESALCKDATNSNSDANTSYSNIIEQTTYQISALYYGWNFSSNPAVVLSNGTC